jgi:hypothetical protein
MVQLHQTSQKVQTYAGQISTHMATAAAAAAAGGTATRDAAATTPVHAMSRGGIGTSQELLCQALWEMHLFDRWLPGETAGMDTGLDPGRPREDTSVIERALDSDASLSYGFVDEVEALVQQRQAMQLSQLSLHLRDGSWRALLPALTRLIQPRAGDVSDCDEEFVTLYRLLYGLTCANGRRGVTITRR